MYAALPTSDMGLPAKPGGARLRMVAATLAAGVALLGLATLAGWAFDVAILRGPVSHAMEARASTGLGFLLAAASLWLLIPGRKGLRRRAGRALGALTVLVGAASLAETGGGGVIPQTAAALILLGLALATLDTPSAWRARTEALLLLTGAIGFLGLVAYAYGARSPGVGEALAPIPPQTALALLALCAGVECARPDCGVAAILRGNGLGPMVTRRLLPIAVVGLPVLGWLRLQGFEAGLYDQNTGIALFVAVAATILVAVTGVTGRLLKRTEMRAGERERQLQAIVDNTTSVITLKAVDDGRYVLVNRRFEELVGRPREEILGSTDHDLFPPEAADVYVANDRRALEAGHPLELEEIAALDDGPHTYVAVRFPLLDAAGDPYAVCGVWTDITERKRAQEAVEEARAKAEQADRTKSEFLSRMSHELRTPLNSVIGFAQLLAMNERDEATRAEYVERILKGGRHLLDLINEVLDISSIESGRLSLSLEPVDADAAVADALALIRPMAADRGIQVNAPAPAEEPRYVVADQQRLKQVLLNLLANAVKYNHSGGSITVSLEEREERVRLAVADTGPGLSPEQVERLFVPFDRLGAEAGQIEGTGLGLALSNRLAEAMHGGLEVESEPGVGSAFFVELPRVERPSRPVAEPADDARTNGAHPSGHASGPRAALKILYIEDNLANLELVEGILSRRPDVELIAAMQGRLGLELAEQHRPDLILLDLHLPDMAGADVLAELLSDPGTAAIPVVIASADATPGQVERLLAAGASDYVTKPLDVRRFLELIDEHREKSLAAAAAPPAAG